MSDPLIADEINLESWSDIVLDTGLLVSYLMNESSIMSEWFDQKIFNDESFINVNCNQINMTELFYVICRKQGKEKAIELIEIVKNNMSFYENNEIYNLAGLAKCQFAVYLADCFSIATAKWLDCPVLFKMEKEMPIAVVNEIKKRFYPKIWVLTIEEEKLVFY
jgi:uncharacterized protein with PIN domain